MEHKVNISFSAVDFGEEATIPTQLQQLMRFHLFTALSTSAIGAVVAKYVVQRRACDQQDF